MTNNTENSYIRLCLTQVEEKLNWGDSRDWSTYDFEKLSVEIQEVTGVALSLTTLKRIWGKLEYNHAPAVTTLNTLAKFAGYADWRSFKQQQATALPVVAENDTLPPPVTTTGGKKWSYWLLALIPLSLVICGYLVWNGKSGKRINPAAYRFSSSKTVSAGVPNSVIFNYDASAAGNDTVFIAQTWDIRRKVAVPKEQKQYSAIYYFPGFFRAKLMVGQEIVKTHDLMITSNGWVALAENDTPVPLYFKKEEFLKDKMVEIDEATLEKYRLPLQPSAPKLRFINVQDMDSLQNDHFAFETTLKNPFNEGAAACQQVEVLILCKDDVIIVPLSAKGCVGDLFLAARGKGVQSSEADLSGFGCDLKEWVQLRVEGAGAHMRFLVNGKLAYEMNCPNPATGIIGLQYRFNGTGAIKDTRFIQGSRVINL